MSNKPLEKGRICVSVERFPKKENGQNVLDQAGNQVFGNKYMQIGEATKWQRDNGSVQVSEKIYLRTLTDGPYEQVTFWDSEKTQNQQQGFSQGAAPQQQQQQNYQQAQQGYAQAKQGYQR